MVVKFADTQKEKEQKKVQQIQTNLWSLASVNSTGISSAYPPLGQPQIQSPNSVEGNTVYYLTNYCNYGLLYDRVGWQPPYYWDTPDIVSSTSQQLQPCGSSTTTTQLATTTTTYWYFNKDKI